jgi:hypothetical protein
VTFYYNILISSGEVEIFYLPLKSLIKLLLVISSDVLGIQLPQAIPDPEQQKQINTREDCILLRHA